MRKWRGSPDVRREHDAQRGGIGSSDGMLTLGLSGNFGGADADLVPGMPDYFFHDAAACIVRDGVLVAAVEEERLNRIKKTTKFPAGAIRACLHQAGARPQDVDAVGYYFGREFTDHGLNTMYLENPHLETAYSREVIQRKLRQEFGWDLPEDRLVYNSHHLAHGLSSYVRSGMDEALVVVLDARGEHESGTVFRGAGGRLEPLAKYDVANSLGTLYESAVHMLAYRFGDEYKVMGLAPYGKPDTYQDVFAGLYALRAGGEYELTPALPEFDLVGSTFFARGVLPRRKGEPFTQLHMDFAAGLQHALEDIAMHVLAHWAESTGLRKLCFTGGVAHNSTLNGVILRSGLFDEVFVHPASHDAGAAEGAALAAAREFGAPVTAGNPPLRSASLGPGLGDAAEIQAKLQAWDALISFERPDDVVEQAAELLAAGSVLGWAHGRSEFGPRALGNRSIIADSRPSENKDRINKMIKKREGYRPFAPVVTAADAATYFDLTGTEANLGFMSFVVDVREERRAELGAVTHVDGTARVQVVEPDVNDRFHRLIARFGELTGTPVLLNTSFNNNAEPIVQTVEDVLATFLVTELDAVVVEDFLVRRRPEPRFDDFALRFRPVTRLAKNVAPTDDGRHRTSYEIYLDYSTGPRTGLSAEAFALLEASDGRTSLRAIAEELTGSGLSAALRDELWALWQQKFFTLEPNQP